MSNYEIEIDVDKFLTGDYEFPNIEKAVETGFANGLKELAVRVEEKVHENLARYGLGDSSIGNDINIEISEDGISISVNNDYAVFVEYGTGIVGDSFQHPKANEYGWIYDINSHGESGWYYPTTESDPNPYKWVSPQGGLYAWTRGMPSRPFMYQTWLWARRSSTQIINKNINLELKKLEQNER